MLVSRIPPSSFIEGAWHNPDWEPSVGQPGKTGRAARITMGLSQNPFPTVFS